MKIFYKIGSLLFLTSPLIGIISCSQETKTDQTKSQTLGRQIKTFDQIDQLSSAKSYDQLKDVAKNAATNQVIDSDLLGIKLPKIPSNLKWIIKIEKYDDQNQVLEINLALSDGKVLKNKSIKITTKKTTKITIKPEIKTKITELDNRNIYIAFADIEKQIRNSKPQKILTFLAKKQANSNYREIDFKSSKLLPKFTTTFKVASEREAHLKTIIVNFLANNIAVKQFHITININDLNQLKAISDHFAKLKYVESFLTTNKLQIALNTHRFKKLIDPIKFGIDQKQFPIDELQYYVLVDKNQESLENQVTIVAQNEAGSIENNFLIKEIETSFVDYNFVIEKIKNLGHEYLLELFKIKEAEVGNKIKKSQLNIRTKGGEKILTINYEIELPNGKTLEKTKIFSLFWWKNNAVITKYKQLYLDEYLSNVNLEDFTRIANSLTKEHEINLERFKELGIVLPELDSEILVNAYLDEPYTEEHKSFTVKFLFVYKNFSLEKEVVIKHTSPTN